MSQTPTALTCRSCTHSPSPPNPRNTNNKTRYIVDGNALFLTATEALWRRPVDPHYAGGGIIVAIGYPLAGTGNVYHLTRRSFDLTVPTPDKPVEGFGGADIFLDFIRDSVRPAVRERFPKVSVSREALYGHSFGGLFALHARFTRPDMFDAYIASSPSIWWNEKCILDEARAFIEKGEEDVSRAKKLPTLMMYLGGLEQDPPQWDHEPEDKWQERKRFWEMCNMRNNVLELMGMIKGCARLHTMSFHEYEGEDHGTVMACSMSRGLATFLEEWPVARDRLLDF